MSEEWQPHKQGRGAAQYNVTYDELDTGKERMTKFSSGWALFFLLILFVLFRLGVIFWLTCLFKGSLRIE